MATHTLDTIWEVDDTLWAIIDGWRGRSASAEAPERVRERVGTMSRDRQRAGAGVK